MERHTHPSAPPGKGGRVGSGGRHTLPLLAFLLQLLVPLLLTGQPLEGLWGGGIHATETVFRSRGQYRLIIHFS